MKIYTFNGFDNDKHVFTFAVTSGNPKQATKALYENKLITDLKFDRLTMRESETWL